MLSSLFLCVFGLERVLPDFIFHFQLKSPQRFRSSHFLHPDDLERFQTTIYQIPRRP